MCYFILIEVNDIIPFIALPLTTSYTFFLTSLSVKGLNSVFPSPALLAVVVTDLF